MSEKKKISPYAWLVIIAVLGFGILLITSLQTINDTLDALKAAKLELVLLLPLIQVTNYLFIGGYYKLMFRVFKAQISWARAWGVVAAMNFVNQILPSGGLSGITYLAYGFRNKLPVGKTSMVQVGRYVAAFSAYGLIAPVALYLLIQSGGSDRIGEISNKLMDSPGALITGVLFISMAVGLIWLLNNKHWSHRIAQFFRRGINRVGGWFNKPDILSKKAANDMVDQFHEGVVFLNKNRLQMIGPFTMMTLSVLAELAIVFVSLKAVGAEVAFAAVFASFVAANVAGVVSVIPGDVGVHEAAMGAMLLAFGVETPIAISAILLYRVFNKIIFLPIGFYFYQSLLKPAQEG